MLKTPIKKPRGEPHIEMEKKGNNNKLTKLKSAIKKWPSFSKLTRTNSSVASADTNDVDHHINIDNYDSSSNGRSAEKLHSVYVGKSRRRYLLSSDVVSHPLFQELIERSGGCEDYGGDHKELVMANCEVVLFEHLLWMLEGGGSQSHLGSMEELAKFYSYAC